MKKHFFILSILGLLATASTPLIAAADSPGDAPLKDYLSPACQAVIEGNPSAAASFAAQGSSEDKCVRGGEPTTALKLALAERNRESEKAPKTQKTWGTLIAALTAKTPTSSLLTIAESRAKICDAHGMELLLPSILERANTPNHPQGAIGGIQKFRHYFLPEKTAPKSPECAALTAVVDRAIQPTYREMLDRAVAKTPAEERGLKRERLLVKIEDEEKTIKDLQRKLDLAVHFGSGCDGNYRCSDLDLHFMANDISIAETDAKNLRAEYDTEFGGTIPRTISLRGD